MVATPFVKRRQQVLKPRDSPDITMTLKPSLSSEWGQYRRNRHRRGIVGSAGVVDRGKGTRMDRPFPGATSENLHKPGRALVSARAVVLAAARLAYRLSAPDGVISPSGVCESSSYLAQPSNKCVSERRR
jgi:hypothetical protein